MRSGDRPPGFGVYRAVNVRSLGSFRLQPSPFPTAKQHVGMRRSAGFAPANQISSLKFPANIINREGQRSSDQISPIESHGFFSGMVTNSDLVRIASMATSLFIPSLRLGSGCCLMRPQTVGFLSQFAQYPVCCDGTAQVADAEIRKCGCRGGLIWIVVFSCRKKAET